VARLATDRGVTCVTRKGDVLFTRVPSPDCGMFQIIRTIMSPKNRCDASKAPDRDILVVFEDVPP
jgi:hypothetical protein